MTVGERFAKAHDSYVDGSDRINLPMMISDEFLWTSVTRLKGYPQ